ALPASSVDLLPVADGGEGSLQALLTAAGGERRELTVEDPLGRPVQAQWAMLPGRRALIETAASSGLSLVQPIDRDPSASTTYGAGQLIRAALEAGAEEILVGLGGSATNDGGAGMLCALGAR